MPWSSHSELRRKLLEKHVAVVEASAQRGRNTWLWSITLTFIVGVAIFNATVGWNNSQLERREWLRSALGRPLARILATDGWKASVLLKEVGDEQENSESQFRYLELGSEGKQAFAWIRVVIEAAREKHEKAKARRDKFAAIPEEDRSSQSATQLAEAANRAAAECDEVIADALKRATSDRDRYSARGMSFDTVTIPLLGIQIAASDMGIVGGIALLIAGYWLTAMLRRENHALGEFIREGEDGEVVDAHSRYTPEERAFAYHGIKHAMVFSVSDRRSWINLITLLSFYVPPAVLATNHLTTVIQMYSKGLGTYGESPHAIVELAVVIAVAIMWLSARAFQASTQQLLAEWGIRTKKWDNAQAAPSAPLAVRVASEQEATSPSVTNP